ncbi:hypothetical protein A3850_001025 [Lewinella sp. 4G2]|nr:hypothetical protein A3850_001025 [Lewinella sp. 4G2]
MLSTVVSAQRVPGTNDTDRDNNFAQFYVWFNDFEGGVWSGSTEWPFSGNIATGANTGVVTGVIPTGIIFGENTPPAPQVINEGLGFYDQSALEEGLFWGQRSPANRSFAGVSLQNSTLTMDEVGGLQYFTNLKVRFDAGATGDLIGGVHNGPDSDDELEVEVIINGASAGGLVLPGIGTNSQWPIDGIQGNGRLSYNVLDGTFVVENATTGTDNLGGALRPQRVFPGGGFQRYGYWNNELEIPASYNTSTIQLRFTSTADANEYFYVDAIGVQGDCKEWDITKIEPAPVCLGDGGITANIGFAQTNGEPYPAGTYRLDYDFFGVNSLLNQIVDVTLDGTQTEKEVFFPGAINNNATGAPGSTNSLNIVSVEIVVPGLNLNCRRFVNTQQLAPIVQTPVIDVVDADCNSTLTVTNFAGTEVDWTGPNGEMVTGNPIDVSSPGTWQAVVGGCTANPGMAEATPVVIPVIAGVVGSGNAYTVNISDTYGDGWGTTGEVRIETTAGMVVGSYRVDASAGAGEILSFVANLAAGDYNVVYDFGNDSYPGETTFQLLDPDGNEVAAWGEGDADNFSSNPFIYATFSVSAAEPLCVGDPLELTESGGAATSWMWSGPNGFTSTEQNPTVTGGALPTAPGTYTYTVVAANATCSVMSSVDVELADCGGVCMFTVTDTTIINPICSDGTGSVSLSFSSLNPPYTFSVDGVDQGPATSPLQVNDLAVGSHTIVITDASSTTCTQTIDVDITTTGSAFQCGDNDMDGILNYVDIDIDGDGITNADEGACADLRGMIFTEDFNDPSAVDGTLLMEPTSTLPAPGAAELPGSGYAEFRVGSAGRPFTLYSFDVDGLVVGEEYKVSFWIWKNSRSSADVNLFLDGVQEQANNIGFGTDNTWLRTENTFTATSTSTTVSLVAPTNFPVLFIDDIIFATACESQDSDMDDIADFLELDSDDDGCSDAFEAGHGGVSLSSETMVAGDVGTNGLVNSLETSDDSGVINYTLMQNFTVNGDCVEISCNGIDDDGDGTVDETTGASVDTDMDGVDDICDEDLDNDGIPNSVECSGLVNIATAGTATQSSDLNSIYTADLAIDGITDNAFNFQHTSNPFPHEWWQVDLGATSKLNQIVIFNRVTCCKARLSNAFVFVSDVPFNAANGNSLVIGQASASFQFQIGNADGVSQIPIDLPEGTAGRYVQIQLSAGTGRDAIDDGFLNMAEVQVFACPDTDMDGLADQVDLDSDGDGCSDAEEAQHGQPVDGDGRVTGPVGDNGLLDALETSPESGIINYAPNADYLDDTAFDVCGCPTDITSVGLDGCSEEVLTATGTPTGGVWTIASTIGSSINPSTGELTLGINTTGADITETITYTAGGCADMEDIIVHAAVIATASNNGPACEGEDIALMASGGTSYAWSGPGGYTSTDQNPTLTATMVAMSGTYTVTVTDTDNCTATATTDVVVNEGLTLTAIGSSPDCAGGMNGSYTVTVTGGTGPFSYDDGTATGANQPANFTVANQSAGSGTVTVTDANGCTGMASFTILDPAPATVVAIVSDPVCADDLGAASLTVENLTAPISYTYSGAATGSGTGTSIADLAAGTYSIEVTGANGCTASTSATVSAPTAVTLSTENVDPACNGETTGSIALSLSSGTIASYSFTQDGGAAVNGTGSTITGVGAGTFEITTTDQDGCTATTTTTLTEADALVLTPTSTDASAVGATDGSYSISIAGGTSPYDYDDGTNSGTGVTTISETGLAAGSYNVTVTDANGCEETAMITIADPSCNLSAAGVATPPTCNGGTDGSIEITPADETGMISYTYTGAAAGAGSGTSIPDLAAGSYSIEVTDEAGCTATVAVIVPATPAITATATPTDPACNGEATGSIALTASSGTVASYTYTGTATGSGTGATIMDLAAGTYDVVITDGDGCEATAAGIELMDPAAVTSDAGVDQSVCGLEADLEAATVMVGSGVWSQTAGPGTSTFGDNTSNTTNVIASEEGTYEYTWTVTEGTCTPATSTVSITFEEEPIADAGTDQTEDDEVCGLVTTLGATGAVSSGIWSQASGPGAVSFSNVEDPAAEATATVAGSYELVWSVFGVNCPTAADTVVVDFTVCDADGDMVLNDMDVDDDNDGILDADEGDGNLDTDGDGIPDSEDGDSDNDGITDAAEAYTGSAFGDQTNSGTLANGDGTSLAVNPDGSLAITYGTPVDTDLDGVPNHLDLDSDADGLPDTFEGNFEVVDGDNDGLVGIGIAPDEDMDGIADTNDPDFAGNVLGSFGFLQDRDMDGILNHLDIDIDNDGIVDNIEGQPTFGYLPPLGSDANGNGLDDQYDVSVGGTAIGYTNSDGGSAPDYADSNSDTEDGTGVDPFDIEENHVPNGATEPVTADGLLDISGGFDDADGDGLADIFDLEAGGFGAGTQSNNNATNGQTPFDQPGTPGGERDWRDSGDNDNDGIADAVDTDDDNDGIPDLVEDPTGSNVDTDGDGSPDTRDLDSDGDGIPDVTEAGGDDPDGDGIPGTTVVGTPTAVDPANPGVTEGAPLDGGAPVVLTPIDTDGDDIPDYLDLDSDNDGITDAIEGGGTDENGDGVQGPGIENDSDSDGLADSVDPIDNTDFSADSGTPLEIPNSDDDANPNYLDLDSDDDGIFDVIEAGVDDGDGNGLVDSGTGNSVPDSDLDGLADIVDPIDDLAATAGTGTPATLPNSDDDEFPNYIDIDSDDDGILDNLEAQLTDAAPLIVAVGADDDMDGIDNAFDSGAPEWGGAPGLDPVDTDEADDPDTPDYVDTDTDGDGIDDIDENGLGTPTGMDANMDGLDDGFPTTQTFADLSNDALPGTPEVDFREAGVDTDGDGIIDDLDECPNSLPGATVNATGCTDEDMDGFFPDADMASATFDPDDMEACIPDPSAGTCVPVDDDGDGYFANYPTTDPLYDPEDDMPCIPDDTVAACDTDGDGVSDGDDVCPFTLAGATVNATGCTDEDMDGFFPDIAPASAQYDPDDMMPCVPDASVAVCDTDGDGVPDAMDSCPTSAAGAVVNAAGCTDEDGDGYFPDLDPSLAAFDPDDQEACIPEPSELLCVPVDADGDGYFANYPMDDPLFDPDDTMVCIPDNTVALCDTDGDGVADGNDLCSGTMAGLMVNADGCPDEDADGFFPLDDDTAADYDPDDAMPCIPDDTVAACDTDGDGVPDGEDLCPTSVAGATVNVNGCTDFDGDGFFPDAPMGPAFDPDDAMVCIPDNTIALCDSDGDGVADGNDLCPNSPAGAALAMGFDPLTGCIDADGDGFFPDGPPATFDPEDNNGCVPNPASAACTPIDLDGDGFFANVPTDDPTYDPDDMDGCNPDNSSAACDTDGDGVADADDACPFSAVGATVNASGCTDDDMDGFFPDADPAMANYDPEDDNICVPDGTDTDGDGFCDLEETVELASNEMDPCDPDPRAAACDSDGDGVADGLDSCPNSAPGAIVNAAGCTDADSDGFFPDALVGTPEFDPEDDNPCVPEVTVLCIGVDDDGDGYFANYPATDPLSDPDDADPCNPDPSVGNCDTDMDGVADAIDQCPFTPAGNQVDANGCSDADSDGFFPGVAPTMATYDPDDANGCIPDATSAACDSDQDGIADVDDSCPNSVPGASVNAAGCTDEDMDGYFPDIATTSPVFDPNDMEACIPVPASANCTPIDEDGDGFFANYPMGDPQGDPDDLDPCNPDPTSAACDGDGDGVADEDDLCPNSLAGAMVNASGCTDDDGDGFFPDVDPTDELFDPADDQACTPDLNQGAPDDDCDEDGNPTATDPNPDKPVAANDTISGSAGNPIVFAIVDNDDFLPSSDLSLNTSEGSTAMGMVAFDPVAGTLEYTPTADEAGTTVELNYEVCFVPTNACAVAIVNITVANCPSPVDTDGDGLTDCEETTGVDDPSTLAVPNGITLEDDACDPDPLAVPTGDCDGDGNPNSTDPNVTEAVAENDTTDVLTGQPAVIDIVANDDYLAGPDISLFFTGGTANGEITFDSLAGTLTYVAADDEFDTEVEIGYQVCNLLTAVCADATVIANVGFGCPNTLDTDMDGLSDCEETTGVDDPGTPAVPNGTSDEMNPCDPDPTNGACDQDGDGTFADVDPNDNDPCDPIPTLASCPDNTLAAEATSTDVTANGANDGTITLAIMNGTGPFTVGYTDPDGIIIALDMLTPDADGNIILTDLAPGIYTEISVTDSSDPQQAVPVADQTIGEPTSPFTATVTSTDVTMADANDGTITIATMNGVGPYTVSFTTPEGVDSIVADVVADTDGNLLLTDLAPGDYTNTIVTDSSIPGQTVELGTVTIGDVGAPPVLTCPADTTVLCSESLVPINPEDLQVESECGVVSIDIADPVFTAGDPLGIYMIDYTVTDSCGQVVTCTRTVTQIDSTPPILIAEDTSFLFLDENGMATLMLEDIDYTTSDNCGPVEVELLENNPDGLTTGTITSQSFDGSGFTTSALMMVDIDFSCQDLESGGTLVYLEATDLSFNTVVDSVLVIVQDTFNPVFTLTADQIDLGFGNTASLNIEVEQVASDNCGTPTVDLEVVEPGAGGPGTVDVIATATDASGNTTVLVFTLPEFFAPSDLACISRINVTLDDDCSATVVPSMVLRGDFGTAEDEDFVIVVMDSDTTNGAVIDGCGTFDYKVMLADGSNVSPFDGCWGTLTAEDKTPPVLVETPDNITEGLLCADVDANNVNELGPDVSKCFRVDAAGQIIDGSIDPQLLAVLSPAPFDNTDADVAMIPVFTDNCASEIEVCVSDIVTHPADGCGQTVIERFFRANEADGCAPLNADEQTGDDELVTSFTIAFDRPTLDSLDAMSIEPVVEIEACGNMDSPLEFVPEEDDYPVLTLGERTFSLGSADAMCSMIAVTYENSPNPIQTCPNTVKFQRTYTVVDWCNPTDVRTFSQFVKVGDTTGPDFSGPSMTIDGEGNLDDELTYRTNVGGECAAFVRLDGPGVAALDACDGSAVQLMVAIYPEGDLTQAPFGAYPVELTNGAPELSDALPLGDYAFVYTATDACGNQTVTTVPFTVVDGSGPAAFCENGLNVSLSRPGGTATLTPAQFDKGSQDDCSTNLTYGIAFAPTMDMPTEFFDEVTFTCDDLGVQFVTLEVTDEAGNSNTCWGEVLVELKANDVPTCIAPSAVTLTCSEFGAAIPGGNLEEATSAELDAAFGTPGIVSTCESEVTSTFVVNNLNECGIGTAVRSYVATDAQGGVSGDNCTQLITIVGVYDYQITLPGDATTFDCMDEFEAEELSITGGACDAPVVSSVTEEVFNTAGEECYQIVTTYTIINTCEYDPALGGTTLITRDGLDVDDESVFYLNVVSGNAATTADDLAFTSGSANAQFTPNDDDDNELTGYATSAGRGSFTYVQTINVFDRTSPVVDVAAPTACIPGCTADVSLPFTATDGCLAPRIQLELDPNFTGTFEAATVDGVVITLDATDADNGNYVINATGVPAGDHAIRITAIDGCGNATPVIVPLSVCGDVAPVPLCIQTLVATLQMNDEGTMAMAEVWATDFLTNSPLVDCFGDEVTSYGIVRAGGGAELAAEQTGLKVFCSDAGEFVSVDVYAFSDNLDASEVAPASCQVLIQVDEGDNVDCGTGGNLVAGTILTQDAAPVSDVEVTLTGGDDMDVMRATDADGAFAFAEVPTGMDYTVTPAHAVAIDLQSVKVSDVVRISRMILGIAPFDNAYDYVAADVTQDGLINVLDMVAIQRVILGLDDMYRTGESWRFVNADFAMTADTWMNTFPEVYNVNDLAANILDADFVAVEMGNVLNAEGRTSLNLETEDAQLESGQTHELTFTNADLYGFQGTLDLGRDLELLDVSVTGQGGLNLNYETEGLIGFAVRTQGEITLTVRAVNAVRLSEAIELTDDLVYQEGVDEYGTPGQLGLSFVRTSAPASAQQNALYQNTPNPVATETTVNFDLAEAGEAVLTVQDVAGRVITTRTIDGVAGSNQIKLTRAELGTGGVYTYTLTKGDFAQSLKMVVAGN